MISKPIPPLSGLTSLVMAISCTRDGVVVTLLLIPISTNMKLKGSYLKSGRTVWYVCNSSWQLTRSQVTGWDQVEGLPKSSCGIKTW
jgi:hypothetical protein